MVWIVSLWDQVLQGSFERRHVRPERTWKSLVTRRRFDIGTVIESISNQNERNDQSGQVSVSDDGTASALRPRPHLVLLHWPRRPPSVLFISFLFSFFLSFFLYGFVNWFRWLFLVSFVSTGDGRGRYPPPNSYAPGGNRWVAVWFSHWFAPSSNQRHPFPHPPLTRGSQLEQSGVLPWSHSIKEFKKKNRKEKQKKSFQVPLRSSRYRRSWATRKAQKKSH